jgi:asparagine synthase (glutamine-hydrolysing)
MSILSGLVRQHGYKVVLTGEGADEVLGGYDLFKEAKIRQFWARQPDSAWRPALLQRLYPYLDLNQRTGSALPEDVFRTGARPA